MVSNGTGFGFGLTLSFERDLVSVSAGKGLVCLALGRDLFLVRGGKGFVRGYVWGWICSW